MVTRIAATEAKQLLCNIPGWTYRANPDTIIRSYKFKSFEDTWSFLSKVAMRSHKLGHHAKITNLYTKVELELTTHDVEGLSELDFKMAKAFEKTALQLGLKE